MIGYTQNAHIKKTDYKIQHVNTILSFLRWYPIYLLLFSGSKTQSGTKVQVPMIIFLPKT